MYLTNEQLQSVVYGFLWLFAKLGLLILILVFIRNVMFDPFKRWIRGTRKFTFNGHA